MKDQDAYVHGWFFEHVEMNSRPVIIYFGGNAEDISYHFDREEKITNVSIFFATYRGYLDHPGKPCQNNIFLDALATYDYLVKQRNILPVQIFLMGRSLGASVATYVASKRAVKGLILVTPFDRIMNVAKQFFYFYPFSWILQGNFNTLGYLKNVQVSTLILTSGKDEIIPKNSTESLINSCPGKIYHHEIPIANHQNIADFDEYYELINDYIHPDLKWSSGHYRSY